MTSAAEQSRSQSHPPGWLFCFGALLALLCLAGCSERAGEMRLSGQTMGTSWHVTLVAGEGALPEQARLQAGIEAQLEAVNAAMSTYRADSELSQLNEAPVGEWRAVSKPLYEVIAAAVAIGEASTGAYDITVGPLVNLWGFGPAGPVAEPPAVAAIEAALARVGHRHLELDGQRLRRLADTYIDLSSIAKGYAVDEVARWLQAQGLVNFMVEVGGEMRVQGQSPRGDRWRVGIEQPDAGGIGLAQAISLESGGVATSGDYRNFFEAGGRRYSHSIDPRSGYPVAHELVSVTVVHASAMIADGWATALTVLGADAAREVALQQGLAVYFIARQGDGFRSEHTPAFAVYLE